MAESLLRNDSINEVLIRKWLESASEYNANNYEEEVTQNNKTTSLMVESASQHNANNYEERDLEEETQNGETTPLMVESSAQSNTNNYQTTGLNNSSNNEECDECANTVEYEE